MAMPPDIIPIAIAKYLNGGRTLILTKRKRPHTPPTDHCEAHKRNRIGEDSSAHGSFCPTIAKSQKRKEETGRCPSRPGDHSGPTIAWRKARWKEHV